MIHSSRIARLLLPLIGAAVLVTVAPAVPVAGRGPVTVQAREVSTSLSRSETVRLPFAASHVALHWQGNPDAVVTVAFSPDGRAFAPDLVVERDEAGADIGTETYGSVIWAEDARFARVTSDRPIARLSIVAMDSRTESAGMGGSIAAAAVAQPPVMSRAAWGADESLRFDGAGNELWPPEFYPTQKLVVHHTAGRNADPDPAATVRAIYHYHAVTRGWGDIGYNFLIDESGRVYEGRYSRTYSAGEVPTGEDGAGNGVTAAHVSGYNSGTVGVALLGTLTEQDTTPAARGALESLLAWKADRNGIDPVGSGVYVNPVNGTQKSMANISSHRDLAATECPGGAFYSTLPALRQAVATLMGATPEPMTVPGAAALSAVTPSAGRGVQLSWAVPDDGGSPITEYRVLRLKKGGFVRIATVSGSATSYRDTSAKRGRSYKYVVRAVNLIGVGPYSNEASAVAR